MSTARREEAIKKFIHEAGKDAPGPEREEAASRVITYYNTTVTEWLNDLEWHPKREEAGWGKRKRTAPARGGQTVLAGGGQTVPARGGQTAPASSGRTVLAGGGRTVPARGGQTALNPNTNVPSNMAQWDARFYEGGPSSMFLFCVEYMAPDDFRS